MPHQLKDCLPFEFCQIIINLGPIKLQWKFIFMSISLKVASVYLDGLFTSIFRAMFGSF